MYVAAMASEWWREAQEYRLHLKLILILFVTLLFSLVYWFLRDQKHWNDNLLRPTLSYGDTLYFSAVTSTTIGFGDITPKSGQVRAAAMVQMLIAFAVVVF